MILTIARMQRIRAKSLLSDSSGMTLLEILVVMVILGLLATLGSLQLMGYLGRAKSQTAKLQIAEISTAIDLFEIDLGRPPNAEEGLAALIEPPPAESNWNGPYLRKAAVLTDPWGRPFGYRSPGEHGPYDLWSLGPDGLTGTGTDGDDVVSWTQ